MEQQAPPPKRTRTNSGASAASSTIAVSASAVPAKWRRVFAFDRFNAVQTACLDEALSSDHNVLLVAPTGCGKTVAMELALIRMLGASPLGKAVYLAPLRSLCAERHRDWSAKFGRKSCVILSSSGDDEALLESAASIHDRLAASRVIFTTPEKWDSVTRSWHDRAELVGQIALLLIDEVHMLSDTRGGALEVVVSRMRTVAQSQRVQSRGWPAATMRSIALSATVPNPADIATWLRCPDCATFVFGDEMRGSKLTTHVLAFENKANGFLFERSLITRVHSAIARYGEGKQTLVFCTSRAGTAKIAAQLVCDEKGARGRRRHSAQSGGGGGGSAARGRHTIFDKTPAQKSALAAARARLGDSVDAQLASAIASGVAYHHAGMDALARATVEKLFRDGVVRVLCATSTLAQGVNLPAFCVIVCSTQCWRGASKGYGEINKAMLLQQIGRAGRPPYEVRGTAVIMTQRSTQRLYRKLAGGLETIESQLHTQLVPYLNAEISLAQTVASIPDAIEWLKTSYFYVRLQQRPSHYKFSAATAGYGFAPAMNATVLRDVKRLVDGRMIAMDADGCGLRPRILGKVMARFMLQFETASTFHDAAKCTEVRELLRRVTECANVAGDLPIRRAEKKVLKLIGSKDGRFTTSARDAVVRTAAQKAFQLCQAALGGIDITTSATLRTDQARVLECSAQVLSGMIAFFTTTESMEVLLSDGSAELRRQTAGSPTTVLCLVLRKCLRKRLWENSRSTLRQLDGVGPKTVELLSAAGISSFARLRSTSTERIEHACRRPSPFGNNLQRQAGRILRCTALSACVESADVPIVHVAISLEGPIDNAEDRKQRRFDADAYFVAVVCGPYMLHFDRFDTDVADASAVAGAALGDAMASYSRTYTIPLPWSADAAPSPTVQVHAIHSVIVGMDSIATVVLRSPAMTFSGSATHATAAPSPILQLRKQGRILPAVSPASGNVPRQQRRIDEIFTAETNGARSRERDLDSVLARRKHRKRSAFDLGLDSSDDDNDEEDVCDSAASVVVAAEVGRTPAASRFSTNVFSQFAHSSSSPAARTTVAPTPSVVRAEVSPTLHDAFPPMRSETRMEASRDGRSGRGGIFSRGSPPPAPRDVETRALRLGGTAGSSRLLHSALSIARRRRASMSSRTCVNPRSAAPDSRTPLAELWSTAHHAPPERRHERPLPAPQSERPVALDPSPVALARSFIDASVRRATAQEWSRNPFAQRALSDGGGSGGGDDDDFFRPLPSFPAPPVQKPMPMDIFDTLFQ